MKKTKRRALYVIAALLGALFVLSCLVGFAACGGGSGDDEKKGEDGTVTGVTVTSSLSLTEGGSGTITATVSMSSGSYSGSYAWVSSDTSVVTVASATTTTSSVSVSAVGVGNADVTVTVGDYSAKCTVTVTAAQQQQPTVESVSITASSNTLNLYESKTAALTATVTMSEGSYSGDYTWSSSDTNVATVEADSSDNSKATVTAVAAGTSTIKVTAGDKDATCSVTVTDKTVSTENGLSNVFSKGGSVSLTENITVSDSALEVKADTTIDLAGKTISTGTNSDGIDTIVVDENATLTITDSSTGETGSIKNTYKSGEGESSTSLDNAAAIETKGTLIIEGGNISSSSVGIRAEGGSVTINGGTIESDYFALWESGGVVDVVINDGTISGKDKGIVVCGDSDYGYREEGATSNTYQDNAVTTLTINGGEISCEKDSAITTLGVTTKSTAVINITGGTITSSATIVYKTDSTTGDATEVVDTACPAIYLPSGTLNISGGKIISENLTAVEVRGGDVKISGGYLIGESKAQTGSEQKGDDASQDKSGAKTYGYALSVYPYGINNSINERMKAYTAFDNTVNVQVTAGTFNGDIYVAAEAEFNVQTGGSKWQVSLNEDEVEETAPYVVTINMSLGFTKKAYSSADNPVCESSGEISYYIFSVTVTSASDETALTQALTTGGEIVLAADITLSGTSTQGGEATALTVSADTEIDLAGKSISTAETLSSALNTIEVSSGATLTIIDSAGEGSIANTYTGAASTDNAAAIAVAEGGTLVIESGAIESSSIGVKAEGIDSSATGRATVTIDGGEISSTYFSIWAAGDADVTISGGTISGENKGICIDGDSNFGYSSYQYNTKTTLTITGGEVSCTNESAICTLGTANSTTAEITITGGTITSSATIVYDDDNTTVKTAAPTIYLPNGTLTITGGKIISENLTAVEVRGGKVNISGGTLIGGASTQGDDASEGKSGAKTYGYALSVYPYQSTNRSSDNGFDNKVNVTVTDGTFTGDIYVAATAEKASGSEELWQVVLNGTDEAKASANYVVTIAGTAITVTETAYDSDGKEVVTDSTDPSYNADATVSYYIVTVTAVAA